MREMMSAPQEIERSQNDYVLVSPSAATSVLKMLEKYYAFTSDWECRCWYFEFHVIS
jgi:hypothetical protein